MFISVISGLKKLQNNCFTSVLLCAYMDLLLHSRGHISAFPSSPISSPLWQRSVEEGLCSTPTLSLRGQNDELPRAMQLCHYCWQNEEVTETDGISYWQLLKKPQGHKLRTWLEVLFSHQPMTNRRIKQNWSTVVLLTSPDEQVSYVTLCYIPPTWCTVTQLWSYTITSLLKVKKFHNISSDRYLVYLKNTG